MLGFVEGEFHRRALEYAREYGTDCEGADDPDPGPAGGQEPLFHEQADVEEEDADLGHPDVDFIEHLCDEVELYLVSRIHGCVGSRDLTLIVPKRRLLSISSTCFPNAHSQTRVG